MEMLMGVKVSKQKHVTLMLTKKEVLKMLLMGLQIRQSSPTTVLMGLDYLKLTAV